MEVLGVEVELTGKRQSSRSITPELGTVLVSKSSKCVRLGEVMIEGW